MGEQNFSKIYISQGMMTPKWAQSCFKFRIVSQEVNITTRRRLVNISLYSWHESVVLINVLPPKSTVIIQQQHVV